MGAELYNKIRRILFNTANDPQKGFSVAYEWLEQTYKSQLGPKGYAGILAELKFYEEYRKEFSLTVAGDMGEHADFSGLYGSEATRFDVTTNLSYKDFKEYEPFMGEGIKYKIAFFDADNFSLIDVLELGFEKCECGGYMIPFVLLLGENYNSKGWSQWTNDQLIMNICSNGCDFNELDRHVHHFLVSPSEHISDLEEIMTLEEIENERMKYCLDNYKYFRREYRDDLMAVAEQGYKITGRKGEGFWTFGFHFVNKAVSDMMPEDVECGRLE
ncbi:MAG: hypothetical protein KAR05_09970 [Candidatus Omnitrophica bacterium]|nr:hypothetical protein [Candidatus Omnitrophota bacterium]